MPVIALAGVIGVGKSSVAEALENDFQFEVRSYSSVVRAEAIRRGHESPSRSILQETGQSLFETLGAVGMTDLLLDRPFERLVIDGVRHVAVLQDLHARLPETISVLLLASEKVLDARWAQRGDTGARTAVTAHHVEAEIAGLRDGVTLVLRTDHLTPGRVADILASSAG